MKKSKMLRCVLVASLLLSVVAAFAADPIPVRVAIVNASSDVGFFIADKKGYFRQEGLDVSFVPFDSGAKMVAPLGNGQLEVGGGSGSAGLYNAIARGIDIKIVA